jgi:5-methyltetrahydropteroyltriglutamate--homocysteine methyltransferase
MSDNRILTSHVGSLVRPADFTAVLRQRKEGKVVPDFETLLTAAVKAVVEKQVAAGIDIVSDGEFGKTIGWEQYAIDRLSGFSEPAPAAPGSADNALLFGDFKHFADFYAEEFRKVEYEERVFDCTGPIRYTGQKLVQRDISNLKAAMASCKAYGGFLPLVAPASATAMSPNKYYKSDEEFMYAVADALREEYSAVLDAGLNVQIDDAHLPFMYDRMVPPASDKDYFKWAQLRIDALNHALKGLDTRRVRYHICWGSWNGPHASDVPLRKIVRLLLKLNVSGYAIEAANARHEHEWSVWKEVKLPPDRFLMPGVVSHQTNVVEHPELVAERLMRFASVVGRERVIGGTDCGFAQGPFVRRVHESIMWAKLESLAEGARIASKRLAPRTKTRAAAKSRSRVARRSSRQAKLSQRPRRAK